MIQVLLKGGLGNQMFEYAYALKVSQAHQNEKICLNGAFLKYLPDKRKIALTNLELAEDTEVLPELFHPRTIFNSIQLIYKYLKIQDFQVVIGKIHYLINAWANNKKMRFLRVIGITSLFEFLNKSLSRRRANQERSDYTKHCQQGMYHVKDCYEVPTVITSNARNKYVWGLFQNDRILDGIEDELRKRFKVKMEASDANKELLKEINSCNSVCLHIRRGDFLSPVYKETFYVCDEHYYAEAVRQAEELIENPVFFCFSNDHESIEWIKQNYRFPSIDIRYVDLNNPDYEEIRLMTACKHFIISNSTFSWWAAVLSDAHPQKRVWAPKTWLKGSSVSLNMDSWTTL